MFRRRRRARGQGDRVGLEVFLVHPGGPYFAKRDDGAWSVPKGLPDPGEKPLDAARREFEEETGQPVEVCAREPEFIELGTIVQRGGKQVVAWAFEGEWPEEVEPVSNTCPIEWPRGSGRFIDIPEIDRAETFDLPTARRKINPAQGEFLDRLVAATAGPREGARPSPTNRRCS